MNRRGFLKTLAAGFAGALAVAELDPERLLWVPGAKTIFLPTDKPRLVTGFEAQRQYNVLQSQLAETLGHSVKRFPIGRCEFDFSENLVRVDGKKVSSAQAARIRLTHYCAGVTNARITPAQLIRETTDIILQRQAAGWPDADL